MSRLGCQKGTVKVKVIALLATLGIVFTGLPPLNAAPRGNLQQNLLGASPLLDERALAALERNPNKFGLPTELLSLDIRQLRRELRARQDVRTLRWLDIITAKTADERHRRIRQLPVTIVASEPTDGRVGLVKAFVAGGKSRIEMFFPQAPISFALGVPGDAAVPWAI
jgi:hypothetical protein